MTNQLSPITVKGEDGNKRCPWCVSDPQYMNYHDTEWGKPVTDDQLLYEKLCLEGFQAGLSWLTILRKRDNFREAFQDFDPRSGRPIPFTRHQSLDEERGHRA